MLKSTRPMIRCKTPAYTVAISQDGSRYLWAGGRPDEACSINVCDIISDKMLNTIAHHKMPVVRARFLIDSSIVSFSFDSEVCRWTSMGELAASNERHLDYRADGFTLSNDGTLALIGDYRGQISGWRSIDGSRSFEFQENSQGHAIWALAIEPNGKRLITGGAEGKLRMWTIANQSEVLEIDLGWGHHVQGLTWQPDGKHFVAAIAPDGAAAKGSKSRIAIFDASTCEEVASLFPDGHRPLCCSFSPDGELIAAAGGSTDRGGRTSKTNCVIHVWNFASQKSIADLTGHTGLVRDLAFSPDSRWLLSAGWDNTVRSWNLASTI
jgi:WD40 repeat protein